MLEVVDAAPRSQTAPGFEYRVACDARWPLCGQRTVFISEAVERPGLLDQTGELGPVRLGKLTRHHRERSIANQLGRVEIDIRCVDRCKHDVGQFSERAVAKVVPRRDSIAEFGKVGAEQGCGLRTG